MREIRVNILECYEKFPLVALGVSCYQKKTGEIVVAPNSIMSEFVAKFPELPKLFGDSVGTFGNCPSIVYTIKGTKYPTKLMSFPITPTSLRVESPENLLIARLAKRFKPYTLIPGWMLRPRMDMIEFSCIKLAEIIRFYKLTDVALVVDSLGLGEGDEKYGEKVRDLFMRHFGSLPVSLCYLPKQPKEVKKEEVPDVVQTSTGSTYTEDTTEEDGF